MKISNLKESPHLFDETIKLIEESFEYDKKNSFYKDFYPLMNKSNHQTCYILVDQNKVIGHLGALERKFQLTNTYSFTMYGGIAIDKAYRGKGLFKSFFNEVLLKHQDNAFQLLWSDKVELYSHFGFHPCGELKQFKKKNDKYTYSKYSFNDLSSNQLEDIKRLYNHSDELRPIRSEFDWELLTKMDSIDLFIKKSNHKIENYFLQNKGQDLTHIIHEYGHVEKELLSAGILWSPSAVDSKYDTLNAFQLKPGKSFNQFIKDYSDIQINSLGKIVTFEFKNENFEISLGDFLQGIFGPGRFEELSIPYIYIPGMISI